MSYANLARMIRKNREMIPKLEAKEAKLVAKLQGEDSPSRREQRQRSLAQCRDTLAKCRAVASGDPDAIEELEARASGTVVEPPTGSLDVEGQS